MGVPQFKIAFWRNSAMNRRAEADGFPPGIQAGERANLGYDDLGPPADHPEEPVEQIVDEAVFEFWDSFAWVLESGDGAIEKDVFRHFIAQLMASYAATYTLIDKKQALSELLSLVGMAMDVLDQAEQPELPEQKTTDYWENPPF